jgi:ribosomal protein S18 acetylase RimI-like enzyme
MRIEAAVEGQLTALAELAALCQTDPQRHIAYVGESIETIAAEIADVVDWASQVWIAWTGDRMVGWLLAETDPDMGRLWWWGPFVEPGSLWRQAAELLYATAAGVLGYAEEEMVADSRSTVLPLFAERHGFRLEEGSALLSLHDLSGREVDDSRVSVMRDRHRERVVALHDELFAGTHTTGDRLVSLVDERRALLVVSVERGIGGYVATELQHDGSLYIDFLGVDPSARRQGLGRALVAAAVRQGASRGASRVHLSVRESNAAARGLYHSLGFVEDRVIRPYRKGFSLA